MFFPKRKKTILRASIYLLEFLALGILAYLIFLPLYPQIKYNIIYNNSHKLEQARDIKQTKEFINKLPKSNYAVSSNRIIIPKIGVNAPVVEAKNAAYGLSRGAWHLPDSSTPDKGGNTVITGHRFKYLPPSNLTFYLLDKLTFGDIITLIWQKKNYYYRVQKTEIVKPSDLSVIAPSKKPVLTVFTCTPLYSTSHRLVVIAKPVDNLE